MFACSITEREREVLTRLTLGYNNTSIAEELGINQRTVKTRIQRLMKKTGATNRVALSVLMSKTEPLPELSPELTGTISRFSRLPLKMRTISSLVVRGMSNREISANCNTTEQVIKNYLRVIYDALGVWTRLELANLLVAIERQDQVMMNGVKNADINL